MTDMQNLGPDLHPLSDNELLNKFLKENPETLERFLNANPEFNNKDISQDLQNPYSDAYKAMQRHVAQVLDQEIIAKKQHATLLQKSLLEAISAKSQTPPNATFKPHNKAVEYFQRSNLLNKEILKLQAKLEETAAKIIEKRKELTVLTHEITIARYDIRQEAILAGGKTAQTTPWTLTEVFKYITQEFRAAKIIGEDMPLKPRHTAFLEFTPEKRSAKIAELDRLLKEGRITPDEKASMLNEYQLITKLSERAQQKIAPAVTEIAEKATQVTTVKKELKQEEKTYETLFQKLKAMVATEGVKVSVNPFNTPKASPQFSNKKTVEKEKEKEEEEKNTTISPLPMTPRPRPGN